MYFAVDLENKEIVSEDGEKFTVEQFRTLLNGATKPIDMTLMCQRFVTQFNFDFEKTDAFYKA